MSIRSRWFAMATVVLLVAPLAILGQGPSYLPGPAPTIDPIQHQCVETLLPQDRTTIGIGEQVNCWIDRSTWRDTDYQVDSYGTQTPIKDSMGTVTWWADGQGSVYPPTGDSTLLTADLAAADGSVTVNAIVPDSGLLGVDTPLTLLVKFFILIPNGGQLNKVTDAPLAAWVNGPPNNNIGANSKFDGQVTPAIVSFAWVPFRENIPAQKFANWPDGTPNALEAEIVEYWVPSADVAGVNSFRDTIRSTTNGLEPIGRLAGWHYEWSRSIPNDFKDGGGTWRQYTVEQHSRNFGLPVPIPNPPYITCFPLVRVGDQANNTLWGGWMGPWQ